MQERQPLNHDDQPPSRANVRREVHRVAVAKPIECVILSEKWWNVYVHYNPTEKRSQPCIKPKEVCAGCHLKMGRRKNFYVNVLSPIYGNHWLEVPEDSAAVMDLVFAGAPSMRGLRARFKRLGAANGPIRCELLPELPSGGRQLPRAETPEETLWKMWLSGREEATFRIDNGQNG